MYEATSSDEFVLVALLTKAPLESVQTMVGAKLPAKDTLHVMFKY